MAKGVENGGAFHGYRRLFVSGQMGDRRPVQASPCVNVDSIDHFIRILGPIVWVRDFVLSGGRKKKTAVRRKSQAPEERRVGFVCVYAGVLDTVAAD